MQNTELLDGTIIAEALNYYGQIEPVFVSKEEMLPGKVIGIMTELEKRLHSLSVSKNEEIKTMFGNIMGGKDMNDPERDDVKKLAGIITYGKNLHYYKRFDQLQREAEACEKLMWILINLRIKSNNSVLSIRPGFKIVALKNTENFLNPGAGLINFS
ncbi:hypothetical protein HXX01_02370 [Candidatus Nomurabacteria bacterium]|nr:hypothetical protein [Candidatus Nomurabacteria bacterium]